MNLVLPLEIINEDEVEEVKNHRKQRYNTQSLVHWKGYGNKHDQWIAKTELLHTKKVIEDY